MKLQEIILDRASADINTAHERSLRLALWCRIPLPFGNNSEPGYVEWLYLDDDLRIMRGSKGSYFIHTRE